MKFIADIFDKKRPDFEKGGKLERFYPLFEAQETFLFVTRDKTSSGSHIRDYMDTKRLMSFVIIALVPCLLFGIYNAGYQHHQAAGTYDSASIVDIIVTGATWVLPIVFVSYAVGGTCEMIFAVVRKHEITEGFLVTGMLYPLTLPPTLDLWKVAVGVCFGVVIGKEVFGGTGMNIFNPALTARAFIFFAYAGDMSGDKPWIIDAPNFLADKTENLVVTATPLGAALAHSANPLAETPIAEAMSANYSAMDMFLGLIPGSIGESSTLLCILGAGLLIATGVGSWRIMLSTFLGCAVTAAIMNLVADSPSSTLAIPVHYHFIIGSFAFGLVYMTTDPVSAAQTNLGKWIYGFFIGVVVVIIRCVNPAYPEGMMLAILLMNAFASLIDYYVVQNNVGRRMSRVATA